MKTPGSTTALAALVALSAAACTIHRTIVIHQVAPSPTATSASVGASSVAQSSTSSMDSPQQRPALFEPESAQPEVSHGASALMASPTPAVQRASAPIAAVAADDYATRYRGAREFLLARKAIDGDSVTNGFGLTFAGQWFRGMFTPVELASDGGAFVGFNERRRGHDFVPRLARVDATGAARWITPLPEFSGHTTYEVNGVYATADGGALAVYCPFRGHSPQSYVVVKVSAAGRVEWRAQMPRSEGYPVFLHRAQLDAAGQLEVYGHYQRLRSAAQELQGWRATVTVDGRILGAQATGDLEWNMTNRPTMHESWYPVYRPYGV